LSKCAAIYPIAIAPPTTIHRHLSTIWSLLSISAIFDIKWLCCSFESARCSLISAINCFKDTSKTATRTSESISAIYFFPAAGAGAAAAGALAAGAGVATFGLSSAFLAGFAGAAGAEAAGAGALAGSAANATVTTKNDKSAAWTKVFINSPDKK